MTCTYSTIETGTCSAPGISVRLRATKVERPAVGGHSGWGAAMRHKVLCPEHRAQGIVEGWITSPF
jgi:hypothetical protein